MANLQLKLTEEEKAKEVLQKELIESNQERNNLRTDVKKQAEELKQAEEKADIYSDVPNLKEEMAQYKVALEICKKQMELPVENPAQAKSVFAQMYTALKQAVIVIEKIYQQIQGEEPVLAKRQRILV